ncbi:hypothetical protein CR513_03472, partial [Mucuna pruriens]
MANLHITFTKDTIPPGPQSGLAGGLGRLRPTSVWDSSIPSSRRLVDLATIDVFLAKRDRGENPVIVVLANTYYTLNYYCKRNGKSLRCYTHLLYLWMTANLFHSKCKMVCPIEDFKWSWIKTMSKLDWTQYLDEAFERTICWYPKWNERE